MDTDEVLVERVAAGDAVALDHLFRRHHARVHALCARLSADESAADDLVQETFIRVLRHAHGFKGRASFTTWLYRIARNVCYDALKKARRQELAILPETEASADPRVDLLERALARLPSQSREALVLARWHDLPYAQIAEVLGCSEGAARVRVHRALTQLRAIVMEMEANV